jgi:hypothetical protein
MGPVLMGGLVALAAVVLPVPAIAESPVSCSPVPVAVAVATDSAPVGGGPCPGVRPGGRVLTSIGDCTLNFLFRAPDDTRYIGTAGHCVDPGPTSNEESNPDGRARIERVWPLGSGPVATDSDGQRIGEFAYAVVRPSKDFALIRLDPGVKASPEMCHFGSPHGLSTTDFDRAIVLHYYGSGAGVGDVAPARSAVALGTPDPDHIYAVGLAVPGDSGAGVMTADGLAIGALVTTGFHGLGFQWRDPDDTPYPSPKLPRADGISADAGTIGITRLGPQLAGASEKLGLSLELVTAG